MKVSQLLGPFEPDKPPHLQDGLVSGQNAYASANGYRPVGQFTSITTALPADFNGGASFIASDQTGSLLSGTLTGLYRFLGGTWNPLLTGLSIDNRWAFTQFGDLAIAVNGGVTQKFDLIGGTIADVPDAPSATSVSTVRDFVVYGGANGAANLVQWSGFNDADDNVPGMNQAGFQPMLTGGPVMGIAGGEYGIIVQRNRVVRMTATGDGDAPFQFDEISPNIGAVSAGSIAQVGRLVFFLSDRGFMMCDGNDVKPIGIERVDRTFFANNPRAILQQMYAAVDPRQTVVAFMAPGIPGSVYLYNWTLDRWSPPITMPITGIMSGFTVNVTLEQLDTLYPAGLDTMPYSLDDIRFAGGDPLFLIVNENATVGALSGANQAASFQTAFVEMVSGRQSRMRWSRPLTDALDGLTVTLDCRQRLGDASSLTSYSTINTAGDMAVRAAGRYVATDLSFAAGADWSYCQGIEHQFEQGFGR